MSSYSTERKQAILSKLLPPNNKTVASVAREEGVTGQTPYERLNEDIQSSTVV
jgi:transposase-like protein